MGRLMIGFILLLLLLGCSTQEQEDTEPPAKREVSKTELQVVVPDEIKKDWSAVTLTVQDKDKKSAVVYTVPIGGSFVIPGSLMKVNVKVFLPNFIMSDGIITSRRRGTANPAVQIEVSEDGVSLFDGWLFALYPKAHSFVHTRYGLSLSGFVAVPQTATKPVKKG